MSSMRVGKKKKAETEQEKKERKEKRQAKEFKQEQQGGIKTGGGAGAKFFNRRTSG